MWLPLTCPLLGTWPATQACALTGNRTTNPLVHRPVHNRLSHTSQGGTHFRIRETRTWSGPLSIFGRQVTPPKAFISAKLDFQAPVGFSLRYTTWCKSGFLILRATGVGARPFFVVGWVVHCRKVAASLASAHKMPVATTAPSKL